MKRLLPLALLLLIACARQVPLTGGLKDLDPPKLISSDPEDQSLNFTGQKITLEFDEYIKQENLLNQLIITPRINGTYKTKLNKTIISLEFEEPFDSATTYSLNFREGIKDITEGNVPPNMKFVFSTGAYLDSISISGSVRDLLTQKNLENITISLYSPDDTVTVFNGTPLYLTKTDAQGNYSLQNIKNGTYLIYAIDDQNQNLKLETRSESYSYLAQPQSLQDSLPNLNFQLYALDNRPLTMISNRPVGKYYDLFFNKSLKEYQINNKADSIAVNLIDQNKAMRLYNVGNAIPDSSAFSFFAVDSLGQAIDTTLYIKFQSSDRQPEKLTSNFDLKEGPVDRVFSANLKLNKPILTADLSQINLELDSLTSLSIPDSMIQLANDQIFFTIDTQVIFSGDSLIENWSESFDFTIPKGSIISVENDSIPEIKRTINFKSPEDFGLLSGDIQTTYNNFTIELIDDKFQRIQHLDYTAGTPRTYLFQGIKPGDYSIRIFVDLDGNGTWDAGNINDNVLPEPIFLLFHPNIGGEKITIRANWEQRGVYIGF